MHLSYRALADSKSWRASIAFVTLRAWQNFVDPGHQPRPGKYPPSDSVRDSIMEAL
jgi:hypothetical protein